MTIYQRENVDRHHRRISRFGKFVRRHISLTLGEMILDWNYSKWDATF